MFCTTMIRPDPGDKSATAKQHEMRGPHGQQHDRAQEAELDRDGENLIVRIGRWRTMPAPVWPTAALAKLLRYGTGAVADDGRRLDERQ